MKERKMTMIDVLNNWMLQSSQNFNIIVSITVFIYAISIGTLFLITRKFGRSDERTEAINLKIVSTMFTTQIIMNALFISWVDSHIDFFRQVFILFQGITFLVGAIYALKLYKDDFR